MTRESDTTGEAYFNLMNALADSVAGMSEAEFDDEMDGKDDVEEIRAILMRSIKLGKLEALKEARQNPIVSRKSFERVRFDLPSTVGEKRDLLQSMLGSMQQKNPQALTAQFREFKDVPDEDLDTILLQLLALNEADEKGE